MEKTLMFTRLSLLLDLEGLQDLRVFLVKAKN